MAKAKPANRTAEKLMMIVGDDDLPTRRVVRRLAAMLPKLGGDDPPSFVSEFIAKHNLGDAIRAAQLTDRIDPDPAPDLSSELEGSD